MSASVKTRTWAGLRSGIAASGIVIVLITVGGAHYVAGDPRGASNAPRSLYIAAKGSDEAPGTVGAPLATLTEAQRRLRSDRPDGNVCIRIAPDTFYNQVVEWTYYVPGHTITISSWPDTGKSWFIMRHGESNPDPFFQVRLAPGDSTRIKFHGLAVRGYNAGAIWLTGDGERDGGWNGGNIIENCLFDSIGNADRPSATICYGIIDFINSRGNTVRNCRLADSDNSRWSRQPLAPGEFPPQGRTTFYLPILGLYLAHGSSANQIYGNVFWNIIGDGIRIRDRSDRNSIHHNLFEKTGYVAAVTMWYCDKAYDRCSFPECPSSGNLFFNNTLNGNAFCGKAAAFGDLRSLTGNACTQQDVPRMSVYDNSLGTCRYHAMPVDTGGIE
jgi:hypothetical protein